jgi:hypothetical protein
MFNCAHGRKAVERYDAGMMFNSFSRARLVGIWLAAVAVLMVCGSIMGLSVTPGSGVLLLATCLVPPAVLLLVWRGAPPFTVAELLHSVDAAKEGRS